LGVPGSAGRRRALETGGDDGRLMVVGTWRSGLDRIKIPGRNVRCGLELPVWPEAVSPIGTEGFSAIRTGPNPLGARAARPRNHFFVG
jgi:hypothetical protein